jgi:hypothetical protein
MPEFRIDDLNPEQLRAATAGEGPVLTIAGAGTGKTKTALQHPYRDSVPLLDPSGNG